MIDIYRMHSTLCTFSMLVLPSPTSPNTPNCPGGHQHLSPVSLASSAVVRSNGDVQAHSNYCTRLLHSELETGNTRYGVCFPVQCRPSLPPPSPPTPGQTSFFFSLGPPRVSVSEGRAPVQGCGFNLGGDCHRLPCPENRAWSFSWYSRLKPHLPPKIHKGEKH